VSPLRIENTGGENAAIEITDLVVRYGEAPAVNGVSFTVAQGEHVTLLGP
jgi:ABC-type sugar transport system ATPase subunit